MNYSSRAKLNAGKKNIITSNNINIEFYIILRCHYEYLLNKILYKIRNNKIVNEA